MAEVRLSIPSERIAAFCRKWKIVELSLFGSVLRDDFGPDSDIDILVRFDPGYHPGIDEYTDMVDELQGIFGREVDLLSRSSVEASGNPWRKHAILAATRQIFAA